MIEKIKVNHLQDIKPTTDSLETLVFAHYRVLDRKSPRPSIIFIDFQGKIIQTWSLRSESLIDRLIPSIILRLSKLRQEENLKKQWVCDNKQADKLNKIYTESDIDWAAKCTESDIDWEAKYVGLVTEILEKQHNLKGLYQLIERLENERGC
jgi:hypothetical protein